MKKQDKQQKAEHIRRLIVGIVTRSGHDVKVSLPSLLREAIRDRLWKQLRKADGSEYKTAVEWLEDGLPSGCMVGLDRAYFSRDELATIIKDLGESKSTKSILSALDGPKSQTNGRPSRQSRSKSSEPLPNPKNTLAVVLQRDYPDYWQGYLDGIYRSVHATAVAAGIKKDGHDPLKRMKSYWRRASPRQRQEFRHWLRTKASREL